MILLQREGVGVVAAKSAESVAAISLYLGINSIVDDITGGNPPTPINVTAINNTTNSILGCINNLTRYSILNSNGLDISGVSFLYGKTNYYHH